MKQYVKMVIFILVLGGISALLLIGTDALTKPRIEQNKKIELYSAILDANDIKYENSNEVFNYFDKEGAQFVVEEQNGLERYRNTENGNYSFIFEGSAMWGPVKGLMTLENDFKTIVAIKILEQEETPGLGAEITNPNFLIKFKGVEFDPLISVSDIANIAGATNTTGFLQKILNSEFEKFYRTFVGDDLFNTEGDIMELLLNSINVDVKAGETLTDVFNEHFETLTEDELKVYVNKETAQASFAFEPTLQFAQDGVSNEEILVVVTLETDFKTIAGMYVKHDGNNAQWGKSQLLTKENLVKVNGKKLPVKSLELETGDDLFDGQASVTLTRQGLELALNEAYDLIFTAFDGKIELKETTLNKVMKRLLDNNNIAYTDDFVEKFNQNFDQTTKDGLTLYTNKTSGNHSYFFEKEFTFGLALTDKEDVIIIVTFEDDFKTIVRINALHDNNQAHFGKTLLLTTEKLQELVGQKLTEELNVDVGDGATSPTTTKRELLDYLKDAHQLYIDSFVDLTLEEQVKKILLKNIGVQVGLEIENLFKANFDTLTNLGYTVYVNKDNGNVSYYFVEEYSLGRATDGVYPAHEEIPVIITLKSDYNKIVKVNAIHDNNSGQWGKTRLFTEQVLAGFIDKNVSDAGFDLEVAGPTVTRNELLDYLKDYQAIYHNSFNLNLEADKIKANILFNNGIKLDGNLDDLLTANFNVEVKNDLILYTHKTNGNVTFSFKEKYSLGRATDGVYPAHEEIPIIITLKSDYNEIVKVTAIHNNQGNQWGKARLLKEEVLDRLIGKKAPLSTSDLADIDLGLWNRVDGLTGATKTETELINYLNNNVTLYSQTFKEAE